MRDRVYPRLAAWVAGSIDTPNSKFGSGSWLRMTTSRDEFRKWFAEVLHALYSQREAGFVILMVSFPLLERYLRQKAGLRPEDDLVDGFYDELLRVFPELPTRTDGRRFWNVYRHGLLHQVAFSPRKRDGSSLPNGWISHDIVKVLQIESDGSLFLHPVLVSQRVVGAIDADFGAFEGNVLGTPGLPRVTEGIDITASGTQHTSSMYPRR